MREQPATVQRPHYHTSDEEDDEKGLRWGKSSKLATSQPTPGIDTDDGFDGEVEEYSSQRRPGSGHAINTADEATGDDSSDTSPAEYVTLPRPVTQREIPVNTDDTTREYFAQLEWTTPFRERMKVQCNGHDTSGTSPRWCCPT